MRLRDIMRSPLRRGDFYTGIICLLPSLAVIAVFTVFPIFFSLFLSFHKWAILTPEKPFVGLANYQRMIATPEFWQCLGNTVLYTLGVVPVGAAASLGLALLLNRPQGSGFFRTTFFLPTITSIIALAVVWLWVYDDDNGLLNIAPAGRRPQARALAHLDEDLPAFPGPHDDLEERRLPHGHVPRRPAGHSRALYEAARIDGAGPWQRFRYVTWPLLVPTTVFVLVTNTIFTFQVFGPIYVMTGGGPVRSTSVVVYHLYQRAFEFQEMGYASAVAWVVFVILIVLTIVQMRLSRKREQVR